MSERKVLNKYFPPDFDPSKIPKRSGLGKESQHKVRLMTPFSMRCNTCGDYIYKGKKFNARKERVNNEDYLGMSIFRFYIRCPRCSAEITFKTDPKNTDYVAELGAQRNFEPWRDEQFASEELKNERKLEEEYNPMRALENRTADSKREMDILDSLDEIRTKNAMNEKVTVNYALLKLQQQSEEFKRAEEKRQLEEDEALAQQIFQSEEGLVIKRIADDIPKPAISKSDVNFVSSSTTKRPPKSQFHGLVRKRNGNEEGSTEKKTKVVMVEKQETKPDQGLSLLATYESDDD
ncbi:hypothetical protein HK098_002986 [Nowakowskiella sp. JEL0407]|nr:hypothetical protein HK098_002986 [Nowakowskiella sp. JEL0407]